jgi:DNA-binding response OmpR family regulator
VLYFGGKVGSWPVTRATFGALRAVPPDLVLLEVHSYAAPAGWALLECLCADEVTQSIPVIVWSTHSSVLAERLARLRTHGCAVVAKPFDINVLLATIKQLVAPRGVAGGAR